MGILVKITLAGEVMASYTNLAKGMRIDTFQGLVTVKLLAPLKLSVTINGDTVVNFSWRGQGGLTGLFKLPVH